ncbi:MAG: sugar transferase [Bacillota bacterium]
MIKRIFDLFFSISGVIILSPLLILFSVVIKLTLQGEVFFKQKRVGQDGKTFKIYKFRTMVKDAESKGKKITVGKDIRITKIGHFLRKYKLDELPQLFNIIKGEMSFVGPRPEVPEYVKYYNNKQREILEVKPGITDYASIYFSNESELLGKVDNPDEFYINYIMPYKIKLNQKYINNINIFHDLKLIIMTILKVAGIKYQETEITVDKLRKNN